MAELVKLREEQQNTKAHHKAMKERLQGMEQKQQQMMAFLARIMQNSNFLQQLVHENGRRWEIQEVISKIRRRPMGAPEHDDVGTSGNQKLETPVKIEVLEPSQDLCQDDASDLESTAKETRGVKKSGMDSLECWEQQYDKSDGVLDDDFWDELLNKALGDEKGRSDIEARSYEDLNGLAE